jgi:predicted HicB family RNase H-like nuclease
MRGVIYALIDNTWDGRYALPFCDALGQQSDQTACYRESISYLKETFEIATAEIAADCAKHVREPKRCIDLAAR